MTTWDEFDNLKGMRVVASNIFRENLSLYLDKVTKTDVPLAVSRFGKPVVVLMPYSKVKSRGIGDYFGFLGKGESGEKFVNKVRRSKREFEYTANLRKRT